jgi:predicted metal-dependent enzyme (double-stranded beta helix superfamily)
MSAGEGISRLELRALVDELAAHPEVWRHLVRHVPDRRTYEEISRREDVGVWLICWMDDHDTGFHDHDISNGAVAVVQGRLREERLAIGGQSTRYFGAGESFDFGAGDIHAMSHAGGGPAVSLHAYSPPLWRMGAYSIDDEGLVQRLSVSYAEELRPLDVVE